MRDASSENTSDQTWTCDWLCLWYNVSKIDRSWIITVSYVDALISAKTTYNIVRLRNSAQLVCIINLKFRKLYFEVNMYL